MPRVGASAYQTLSIFKQGNNMKLTTSFTLAALALFAGTAAIAQTTPVKPVVPAKPAVTAPAVTAPVVTAPVVVPDAIDDAAKKAKSKACSDQADAKKLHGKERKKFREECKKAA